MDKNKTVNPDDYKSILFFTGAGMSAESGVPTYRGKGGIWHQYNWEDHACQRAFEKDPEKVIKFHELRREKLLVCKPHPGHEIIAAIQKKYSNVSIVTQNIDGMHQRAGSKNVIELHGNIWRVRCERHGKIEDIGSKYTNYHCKQCGSWLRPDITWFEDILNTEVLEQMNRLIDTVDLFISIGTSGVVYPAAIYPVLAKQAGSTTVCINTEPPEVDSIFDTVIIGKASTVLAQLFGKYV